MIVTVMTTVMMVNIIMIMSVVTTNHSPHNRKVKAKEHAKKPNRSSERYRATFVCLCLDVTHNIHYVVFTYIMYSCIPNFMYILLQFLNYYC